MYNDGKNYAKAVITFAYALYTKYFLSNHIVTTPIRSSIHL